jgi:hypothetical protein
MCESCVSSFHLRTSWNFFFFDDGNYRWFKPVLSSYWFQKEPWVCILILLLSFLKIIKGFQSFLWIFKTISSNHFHEEFKQVWVSSLLRWTCPSPNVGWSSSTHVVQHLAYVRTPKKNLMRVVSLVHYQMLGWEKHCSEFFILVISHQILVFGIRGSSG